MVVLFCFCGYFLFVWVLGQPGVYVASHPHVMCVIEELQGRAMKGSMNGTEGTAKARFVSRTGDDTKAISSVISSMVAERTRSPTAKNRLASGATTDSRGNCRDISSGWHGFQQKQERLHDF